MISRYALRTKLYFILENFMNQVTMTTLHYKHD